MSEAPIISTDDCPEFEPGRYCAARMLEELEREVDAMSKTPEMQEHVRQCIRRILADGFICNRGACEILTRKKAADVRKKMRLSA